MSNHRAEMKAKLLARVEASLDKLVQDERLHEAMSLREIEQLVGQSAADFRQAALEEMLVIQAEQAQPCPSCGGKLRNKGKRSKQIVSLRGETTLERTYYQCEGCGRAFFPPR